MTTYPIMPATLPTETLNRLEGQLEPGLRIPLGKKVHQIALAFASEQATVAKGRQVFFNTLAVIAVHKCLKWFGCDTDLENGDCWKVVKRAMFNVSDILIPEIGIVECLPILLEQNQIGIESCLLENRSGAISVRFHEHLNYVEMLGFVFFDDKIKFELKNSSLLNIDQFKVFEHIFNYIFTPSWRDPESAISIIDIIRNQVSQAKLQQAGLFSEIQYQNDPDLFSNKIPAIKYSNQNTKRLFRKIEIEEENVLYKILVSIVVSLISPEKREITIQLLCLNQENFPSSLLMKCYDTDYKLNKISFPSNQNNVSKSFSFQKAGNLFEIYLESSNYIFANKFLL